MDLKNMHPALRSRIRGYGYEVYLNEKMKDTPENRLKLAQFIAQEVKKDGKIPHFSNTKVKWKGKSRPSDPDLVQPTCRGNEPPGANYSFPGCGIKTGSKSANNAKSLNKTKKIFASHRACKVDC